MSEHLHAHDFTAEIEPSVGGLIRSLCWRGQHLLHPALGPQDAGATASRFGLWPLVPFANRAFGARLLTPGGPVALPVNDAGDGSTMHGFGWQSPWRIAARAGDSLTMTHEYPRADPYCYAASLTLSLGQDRARVAIEVRNTGKQALPFGIGLHPWFVRDAGTRFRFAARRQLVFGDRYRASGVAPFALSGYAKGRLLPGAEAISAIDWDGEAELTLPGGTALRLSASDTMRHPVLWTPPGAAFVCFEPQSHAIGAPSEAIVAAATPMRHLRPGETLAGWMDLEPFTR